MHKKGDNNLETDTLFNEGIEDELSVYEDRITLDNIAKLEKDLEKKKEEKKLSIQKKKEKQKLEEQKKKMVNQLNENKAKKKKLKACQEKIDRLLKVMKISDMMDIERTFEDLQ